MSDDPYKLSDAIRLVIRAAVEEARAAGFLDERTPAEFLEFMAKSSERALAAGLLSRYSCGANGMPAGTDLLELAAELRTEDAAKYCAGLMGAM